MWRSVQAPTAAVVGYYRNTGIMAHPLGIKVVGSIAYISGHVDSRLVAIDVSNPASPGLAWSYQDVTNIENPNGIDVVGGYAYLNSFFPHGFAVVDLSGPSTAGFTASATANAGGGAVKVIGNYAYIGNAFEGIRTVDVTTKSAPAIIHTYAPRNGYFKFRQISASQMIAWSDTGVGSVMSIATPSAPSFITDLPAAMSSGWGDWDADTARVAGSSRFHAIDMTTPATPDLLASPRCAAAASGSLAIDLDGDYATITRYISPSNITVTPVSINVEYPARPVFGAPVALPFTGLVNPNFQGFATHLVWPYLYITNRRDCSLTIVGLTPP